MAELWLAVGDLHFTPANREDVAVLWDALRAIIERERPTAIVLLGDTLDTHRVLQMDALNGAVWFFEQCCTLAPTWSPSGGGEAGRLAVANVTRPPDDAE